MTWRIFYSYAHEDAELRQKLSKSLAPLRQQQKIVEWHDREIRPGADWNHEISAQLDSANLILLLVSADFLASDYCYGVEIEKAMTRLKRNEAKVVPILLRPCLWEESRFSELQIIPRDAKAITSWPSQDEAFNEVARALRELISGLAPLQSSDDAEPGPRRFDASLDLVREQVHSYSRLYERTRQRMRSSHTRTQRMDEILTKMRSLALAAYPLLDELADSPSPGERLSAVAILQVFAAERYLPFLVRMVGSQKPFVQYQAIIALRFAVDAIDPRDYRKLSEALNEAETALRSAEVRLNTDRHRLLQEAKQEFFRTVQALDAAGVPYD